MDPILHTIFAVGLMAGSYYLGWKKGGDDGGENMANYFIRALNQINYAVTIEENSENGMPEIILKQLK